MQINKPLSAKEKKIRKRERAKLRRKNQELNAFSFQNELIDLVSERSDHQDEAPQEIIEENPKDNLGTSSLAHKDQDKNQKNGNCIKISDDEYYSVVQIGKFYKVKKENERIPTQMNSVHQNQRFLINGSENTKYLSINSFVFCLKRQGNIKKIEQYIAKFPIQTRQLISSSLKSVKVEGLVRFSSRVYLQETVQPWTNLPNCIQGNDSLMLIGIKNTGKSTLAEFLLHSQGDDCVILDCDIGRNSCLEGCVSLTSCLGSKKIWIGQLTPLNNLQTYVRAIRYLYQFYSKNLFTKKLVVNTMGYLTGLGQFLLYEIYQIVKPKSVLVLQSRGERYQLNNILYNLKSGNYVTKLYVTNGSERNETPSSTNIYSYENIHTVNKRSLARFQKLFESQQIKINSLIDLIQAIKKSNPLFNTAPHLVSKERAAIDIYEQSRHGKEQLGGQEVVSYRKLNQNESADMRLVILGNMIDEGEVSLFNRSKYESSSNLFEVSGLGFGFQDKIYYKNGSQGSIGIVNEGMDFEKGFYHLNEKQLIDLELRYGRLNFMIVTAKGLGTKGVRNNPSKVS